ncbi:MAG TPA: peptidylprolyl isomerase [Candidatus Binatia bacterium]|jgi:peptidyl-prolyl cis-trans isomerase C
MPKSRIVAAMALAALAACSRDASEHKPAAAASAAPPAAQSGGGKVIASYANKTFTQADFARELDRLPPRSRTQLTTPERKRQFVDNYILNDLLASAGSAHGYDKDPEVERQVDELRRRLVVQRVMKDFQEPPEISDAEVKSYYEQNRRMFSGSQIRASHILVKDEEQAKRIREELRQDPSKFEELAKTNSTDTATAARGGDLGFFGQGRMVAPFEQAAFALEKPGDISDVVKTPFGFHIIKLTERKEGTERPFEEVKERIRVNLMNQKRQDETQKRLDDLREKANVKVDEAVLAATEIPGAPPPGAPPVSAPAAGAAPAGGSAPSPAAP